MPGTLAAVAAAGYREVEFAGYFGRTPADVRQGLDANGLTAPSTHVGLVDVRERFGATAESAQAIGIRYLTVASLDMRTLKSADDWKRMADVFNDIGRRAREAGQDPRAYFEKHPGRFEMVHVKDATAAPASDMTDVGAGVMDWPRILSAHTTAGIRHYFVEHDNPTDPMQSIRRSAGYLKTLRF